MSLPSFSLCTVLTVFLFCFVFVSLSFVKLAYLDDTSYLEEVLRIFDGEKIFQYIFADPYQKRVSILHVSLLYGAHNILHFMKAAHPIVCCQLSSPPAGQHRANLFSKVQIVAKVFLFEMQLRSSFLFTTF